MDLKLYPTPGDFLRDNQAYLEAYEAPTQLNQGNARAHAGEPCCPALLFGRYEREGEPVLLFGNTAPWNICLNAPPAEDQSSALLAAGELAVYLKKEGIPIAGVTGREQLCRAFMEAHGGEFRVRSILDIMVLTELIEPPVVEGRVRKAEMKDLDTLSRWMCGFMEEALHEPADPVQRRERDRENIENGTRWVLEAPDGTLLSTAGTSRRMDHSVSITAVYTPPEHRGRGYCQFTVAAVCKSIFAEGFTTCTLFVNRENPISNRAYKKLGFTILEDSSEYKLVKNTGN